MTPSRRHDDRAIEERVADLEELFAGHAKRLEAIATAPTESSRLRHTTGTVVAVVGIALTMSGVSWALQGDQRAATAATRSDLRDIITKMNEQEKALATEKQLRDQATASQTKLQDERAETLKVAIDDLKKEQKMLREVDLREVRNMIESQRGVRK